MTRYIHYQRDPDTAYWYATLYDWRSDAAHVHGDMAFDTTGAARLEGFSGQAEYVSGLILILYFSRSEKEVGDEDPA